MSLLQQIVDMNILLSETNRIKQQLIFKYIKTDNNITITEIAKRYKINITTIYKILKRFNIKFKRNNISKSVYSLKD